MLIKYRNAVITTLHGNLSDRHLVVDQQLTTMPYTNVDKYLPERFAGTSTEVTTKRCPVQVSHVGYLTERYRAFEVR